MRRSLGIVGRRAISSIPVLLIVIVGTFFLMEAAPGDAVAQGGVAALQKRDDWGNRTFIARKFLQKMLHAGATRLGGQGARQGTHLPQHLGRQNGQHQTQSQVLLDRIHALRAQKAGQVGGRGVRRVELRHRRDDAEHLDGLRAHMPA